MPPRTARSTRSKGAAADNASAAAPTATSKYTLEAESTSPPQLFVLPKKATADARIVTLPHPRYTAKPTRFLVCPETGVYEFTRVASPKTAPRSWLITGEEGRGESTVSQRRASEAAEERPAQDASSSNALPLPFAPHTTQDADLFVASAVDPLFLVLPALVANPRPSSPSDSPSSPRRDRGGGGGGGGGGKRMFLTADDHLDALPAVDGSHLAQLLRLQPALQARFTARMAVVCDTVAAGDETMYRLNEDKLLLALLAKAQRTSQHLPASLEAKFVTKALEAPVLSIRSVAAATGAAGTQASTPGSSTPLSTSDSVDSGAESQATASSAAGSFASEASAASTAATSVAGDDAVQVAMQASDEVVALQRLRVAFEFICSRYVPPGVAALLQAKLRGRAGGVDFAPLDAYLAKLAALRQQTVLARSAALDYAGYKRGLDEDDGDERAEKRRKLQEEEKRKKAGESRGVRELKKVNVTGMRKLSDFFKKK